MTELFGIMIPGLEIFWIQTNNSLQRNAGV